MSKNFLIFLFGQPAGDGILDQFAIAHTQAPYFKFGIAPIVLGHHSENKLSVLAHQDRPALTGRVSRIE